MYACIVIGIHDLYHSIMFIIKLAIDATKKIQKAYCAMR